MNPYATIRAALESIRVCDDMTGEREAALAALAELEKAAQTPAPVAEIREAVITDEAARKVFNAWIDARWRLNEGQDAKYGHAMINVVRAELGPALGLVEIREPTPEECERIYAFWLSAEGCIGRTPGERMGRIMFAAVREVMGGGE